MCFHKCIALSLNNAVEFLIFDMFIEELACQSVFLMTRANQIVKTIIRIKMNVKWVQVVNVWTGAHPCGQIIICVVLSELSSNGSIALLSSLGPGSPDTLTLGATHGASVTFYIRTEKDKFFDFFSVSQAYQLTDTRFLAKILWKLISSFVSISW